MRVLIVEDEASMAASLRRGLEAEGYRVDTAEDGQTGLWMASESDYDAVILDLMLPKLNGFAVAARLRERDRSVPILILTAKDGEWDQAEALDSGADDFLSKPFSYPVLLARLRALIRRSAQQYSNELALGHLRLDLVSHRCLLNGRDLNLSAREFSLLEYLMLRPDQSVTKAQLLHHVWDRPDSEATNVVEVYIGYLRRKIDPDQASVSIETLRGVGYRLVHHER